MNIYKTDDDLCNDIDNLNDNGKTNEFTGNFEFDKYKHCNGLRLRENMRNVMCNQLAEMGNKAVYIKEDVEEKLKKLRNILQDVFNLKMA